MNDLKTIIKKNMENNIDNADWDKKYLSFDVN